MTFPADGDGSRPASRAAFTARPTSRPGRRPGERGIWQRRFWEHVITDTDDLAQHIAYIHGNPVKHRLVADMDDWPFSSWHRWKRDNAAVGTPRTVHFGDASMHPTHG